MVNYPEIPVSNHIRNIGDLMRAAVHKSLANGKVEMDQSEAVGVLSADGKHLLRCECFGLVVFEFRIREAEIPININVPKEFSDKVDDWQAAAFIKGLGGGLLIMG